MGIVDFANLARSPLPMPPTQKLADRLEHENDVLALNFADGFSGKALVRDSATPANTGYADITGAAGDFLAYADPDPKNRVHADGLVKYNAHNLLTWSLPDSAAPTDWATPGGSGSRALTTLSGGAAAMNFTGAAERPFVQQIVTLLADTRYRLTAWMEPGGSATLPVLTVSGFSDSAIHTANNTVAAASAQGLLEIEFTTGADTDGFVRYGLGSANTDTGDITIGKVQLSLAPADGTFVGTTGAARFAVPLEYDPASLDSSATTVTVGTRLRSFTTAGDVNWRKAGTAWATATAYSIGDRRYNAANRSYCCIAAHVSAADSEPGTGLLWRGYWKRDEYPVRVSSQADVDGKYMTGTVDSFDGADALVVDVATAVGPGSAASAWHIIQPQGVLIEEARTSLETWSRDATRAAWSKTDIAAAKDREGIDGVANAATRLTATGANGTCVQAVTSAQANRVLQVFVQRLTGSGAVELTLDGGSSWTDIAATLDGGAGLYNGFHRFAVTQAALTDPAIGLRIAADGDEIAVDYANLQSAGFATSPVLAAGSLRSRASDRLSLATDAFGFNANEFTVVVAASLANVDSCVVAFGTDTIAIRNTAGADGLTLYNRLNGTSDITSGVTATGEFRAGSAVKSGDSVFAVNGEAFGTSVAEFSALSLDTLHLGALDEGLATITGHISTLKYLPRRVTDDELLEEVG